MKSLAGPFSFGGKNRFSNYPHRIYYTRDIVDIVAEKTGQTKEFVQDIYEYIFRDLDKKIEELEYPTIELPRFGMLHWPQKVLNRQIVKDRRVIKAQQKKGVSDKKVKERFDRERKWRDNMDKFMEPFMDEIYYNCWRLPYFKVPITWREYMMTNIEE